MALAVRELELVLIARDNASSVIARVGGAMVILGGIITATGIKGAKELSNMTKEAMEFRQEIALAVTQADGLGATIENVAGIVNRVGKDLPVPFEELNEAMFDIFSTFTKDQLSSLEQAEMILRAFGESAVAGQAPVRDIARSTIAWINALDQPATIENITKLLDIQFELVRKGAGTYEEFAGEVGKAIPAFAAAGQTVETFAGIMAFLTKNGLNAAMAATSAARAAELMFAPKAIKGLREIGIAVEDSGGNFRAMEDIIRDLVPVMGSLTDAQRKLKFKEIFGTGRIQARRFFDLAIPNFAELEELIGDMEQAGGGVASAFEFMFGQPLSQMELFRNKWELLRRTIGEAFIENMQTVLFPTLQRLFDWWDDLSPEMQNQIAVWAGWATVITTVAGALLMVLGVGLLLVALLKAFSGATAAAGLIKMGASLGVVGLVLAAIALAAFLIWKNWKKVGPILKKAWESVIKTVKNFMEANKEFFDSVVTKAKEIWDKVRKLGEAAARRARIIWESVLVLIYEIWDKWGDDIWGTVLRVWGLVKAEFLLTMDFLIATLDLFTAIFEGRWGDAWKAIKEIAILFWKVIVGRFKIFAEIISQIWRNVWDVIKSKAIEVWDKIKSFLSNTWDTIKKDASNIWNGILDFFKGVWESMTDTVKSIIDGKDGILEFFQLLPERLIDAVFNLQVMLVEWMGKALGAVLEEAIIKGEDINTWFYNLPDRILDALPGAITWLADTGKAILSGLWTGIKWSWNNLVYPFFTSILPSIAKIYAGAHIWLFNAGKAIIKGLWTGMKWYFLNLMIPWVTGISTAIVRGVGNLAGALWNAGWSVISGLWNGMKSRWSGVTTWLSDIKQKILGLKGPRSADLKMLVDNGNAIMQGLEIGMRQGFDRRIAPLLEDFTLRDIPGGISKATPSTSTITNNDNGQVFNFGDIISQADPDEIAQSIAWELRMV